MEDRLYRFGRAMVVAILVGAVVTAIVIVRPVRARASDQENRIAFVIERGGIGRIYTIRPDGAGLRLLTKLPAGFEGGGDRFPAWSSDGRQIAFARDRGRGKNERVQLYIMRADGTGAHPLRPATPLRLPDRSLQAETFNTMPSWSPDGKSIVFIRAPRPGAALAMVATMRIDKQSVRPITFGYVFDTSPVWGPDGSRIAFGHEFKGRTLRSLSHLFPQLVVREVGTEHGFGSANVYGTDFSWSQVGARLVYTSFRDRNGKTCPADGNLDRYLLGLQPGTAARGQALRCLAAGEIYVADAAEATTPLRLTKTLADDRHPSWSSDGTEIVVSSGYPDRPSQLPQLVVMSSDGSSRRVLFKPHKGSAIDPAWAPKFG